MLRCSRSTDWLEPPAQLGMLIAYAHISGGRMRFLGIEFTSRPAPPELEQFQLQPLIVDGSLIALSSSDAARLSIPAAYRGTQIIRDMCAQLPWRAVYGSKHSDQGAASEPQIIEPKPAILVEPSPFMDRDDVIRTIVNNLILRGWAPVLLQNLDESGRPRFATPLNPDEVTATWNPARTAVNYKWRGREMVPGIDLLVIELQRLPGYPTGCGPFDAAASTLAGVDSANSWSRDLFSSSGIPSGTIQVPGKLTKDEAEALKEQWQEQHRGGRSTAVLSGGMTYEAVSLTPEQAQFLMTRALGIQEVARLLGIPQHFLNAGQSPGSGQSLTYTNVQAVFRELVMVLLYPTYLRRLEAAFSSLLPRGQTVDFDLSDFVKADDGTRYTAYETAIRAGILTTEEVRKAEGLTSQPESATI